MSENALTSPAPEGPHTDSEIAVACSLANTRIRTLVMPYLSRYEFESRLARLLSQYFQESKFNDANLRSYLVNNNASADEIRLLVAQCRDYVMLTEGQEDNTLEMFRRFYLDRAAWDALSKYSNDPEALIREVKDIPDFSPGVEKYNVITLGDVDLSELKKEVDNAVVVPSCLDFINRTTTWRGYLMGQVVMVIAPPGTGKTLYMTNEAINFLRQGKKVVWFALADMTQTDFIINFASIATATDRTDVLMGIEDYFTSEIIEFAKNFKLILADAGEITPEEIDALIKTDDLRDCDVVFIDYDANIKKSSDSMYAEGEAVYNKATSLARPRVESKRLVFVASQPKNQNDNWKAERIPSGAGAESARKEAIADVVITIGRSRQTPGNTHIGVISKTKDRRGDVDEMFYEVGVGGIFREITPARYVGMKTYTGEGDKRKNQVPTYV